MQTKLRSLTLRTFLRAARKGPLCINDVVYAELSVRYDRIEDLDAMLNDAAIEVARTPQKALFLAGKVCLQYVNPAVREPACSRIFSSARMRR
jgi:hypothetical protein